MKRSRVKLAMAGILFFVAASTCVAVLYSYSQMRKADRFLHDVMTIRPETASSDVLQMLFERYGSNFTPEPYAGCSYSFAFSNRIPSAIGLAPRTSIGAAITFHDGHVSTVGISYDIDPSRFRQGIGITKNLQPDTAKQYDVSYTDYGEAGKILQVHLSNPTDSQQSFVLSSINLHCLVSLRGCSDSHELAPALYEEAVGRTAHRH